MKGRIGGDEVVCIVGLGYVGLPKLFAPQKPLLKMLTLF